MSVLLQISDTHFGTEQAPVVAALLRFARAQQPSVVVWSGDITQRARRAQFAAARRFADQLQAPRLLVVPGNHDIPLFNLAARIAAPYANFKRVFGDALEPCIATPDWLVIGVNTTRAWRHKHGEVSRGQIDRVASQLRGARPGQFKVVVVHQPVCVPIESERGNLLRGHEAAVQAWAAAGVDVIMGGHIHLPYVIRQVVAGPRAAQALWVVQAGTALSSRVRAGIPNSVNLIRQEAGVIIERWDFDGSQQAFRLVSAMDTVNAPAHARAPA